MDPSTRFWDKIAERYARQPIADEAAYQKKLEATRGYLRPESDVLEFGCGTGSTAIAHAPQVRSIHAIDISSKMIGIARARAEAAGVANVVFEQGSIEAADIASQSLDVVLGLSILHLLKNRDAVIAKVRSILKPGGVFISSTICIGDSMGFLRLLLPVGRALGLIPMVRVFTRAALVDSLQKAGFEIDYEWQPAKRAAVYIVARKPG